MTDLIKFIDRPGKTIKFKTAFKVEIYDKLKNNDFSKLEETKEGIFQDISNIFLISFAIGFHFEKDKPIAPKSVNHLNLETIRNNRRDALELIVTLILKRHPDIEDPEELWDKVNQYAEYGIQILNTNIKNNNNMLELEKLLE